LLVYGLTNLAKMGDDSLDKMDPYQRGSRTMSMYLYLYIEIIKTCTENNVQFKIESVGMLSILVIILVWESMMKGGFFTSQTTNKFEQDLTDPLGKYYKINIIYTSIIKANLFISNDNDRNKWWK
jgi:hypothetical protein